MLVFVVAMTFGALEDAEPRVKERVVASVDARELHGDVTACARVDVLASTVLAGAQVSTKRQHEELRPRAR